MGPAACLLLLTPPPPPSRAVPSCLQAAGRRRSCCRRRLPLIGTSTVSGPASVGSSPAGRSATPKRVCMLLLLCCCCGTAAAAAAAVGSLLCCLLCWVTSVLRCAALRCKPLCKPAGGGGTARQPRVPSVVLQPLPFTCALQTRQMPCRTMTSRTTSHCLGCKPNASAAPCSLCVTAALAACACMHGHRLRCRPPDARVGSACDSAWSIPPTCQGSVRPPSVPPLAACAPRAAQRAHRRVDPLLCPSTAAGPSNSRR